MVSVIPSTQGTVDQNRWMSFRCVSTPLWGSAGLSPCPTPLSSVISKFTVTHHLYADDTQICLELDSRNFDPSSTELAKCLGAVQVWMGNNKLKLNPDKMEFIVIGDDQTRSSLKSSFPVSFLGNIMELAESVKNLGVILDAKNSMQRHMANLCHICCYHLRGLQRVRRYLNHETAVKVANAVVSSHLDYCNLLLYHTKEAYTVRLQRVQNALCHTVCKLNKFSHVTPFLHKLHWLHIHYCILFKYNLLTYNKAIHFSQTPYLSSLIRWSDLTRGSRQSISSSKLNKRSGLRSFTVAAPTEWNNLPQAIRTVGSISGFRNQFEKLSVQMSLSSNLAYLPYRTLIWILTSFLELDYPFLDISTLEDVYINFGAL